MSEVFLQNRNRFYLISRSYSEIKVFVQINGLLSTATLTQ